MFRLNRAMVDVHRMHRDGRLMQQVSTRREQNLQHVPQQQQRAGTFQSNDKRPGGGLKTTGAEAAASGPQPHES
jgi:hypothetical protein